MKYWNKIDFLDRNLSKDQEYLNKRNLKRINKNLEKVRNTIQKKKLKEYKTRILVEAPYIGRKEKSF